jgi:neutral ceramidase
MTETLFAGIGKRITNPPIGSPRFGVRLFADQIQAIESDIRATALVFSNGKTKAALIALDMCELPASFSRQVRQKIASLLEVPVAHVLINFSHAHATPTLPTETQDSPERMQFARDYAKLLEGWILEAVEEANANLQPARIGAGKGEAVIGIYRRETGKDGKDVLGEVPDYPIDHSVPVVRVDDLKGQPIAILFSYGCHPVSVGPRAFVSSPDYPGAARNMVEKCLGGTAVFLQGCGGNVNPKWGIGYEIDCRDSKNRLGAILAGEVLKVAADIHTHVILGERVPLGNVPNILFHPWEPVDGCACTYLGGAEEIVPLDFIDLPPLEKAQEFYNYWSQRRQERQSSGAQDWEIRLASMYEEAYRRTVEAVKNGKPTIDLDVHALRINDIVFAGLSVEAFTETGMKIKALSPFPNTIPMGWTNTSIAYLDRAEDYPEGGYELGEVYHLPDLFVQAYLLPTALHPNSEAKAVQKVIELIGRLSE